MMKRDWRIHGKPYRGARRTMMMLKGFETEQAADDEMNKQIEAGELDPDAWTTSCLVKVKPAQS